MTTINSAKSEAINKIIGYHKGIPLRIYNIICIRVTLDEYIKFIDANVDFNLSARGAILKYSLLCESIPVVAALDKDYIGLFYRGRKLKKYNRIKMRVSIPEYKAFIDAKIDDMLSARQAILRKKLLCQCDGLVPISAN